MERGKLLATELALKGVDVSWWEDEIFLGAYVLGPIARDADEVPIRWGIFHESDEEKPLFIGEDPSALFDTLIDLADIYTGNHSDDL